MPRCRTGCQQIDSLERYRRTLLFNNLGLTPAQMQPLGGGATLFTLNTGNALADVDQTDIGAFVQDDWRMRPNLTVSLGLRYETQTNIHDWSDFAPRIGVAWAPGARGGRQPKTVIRGGSGFFYTRFDNSYALDTQRFNGILEQSYSIVNPTFSYLTQGSTNFTGPNGRRALPRGPRRFTSRIRTCVRRSSGSRRSASSGSCRRAPPSQPRSLIQRAPTCCARAISTRPSRLAALRPYPSGNEIFLYESSGIFNQKQLMVNVNTRASKSISLFGFYTLGYANSDTDSARSFPGQSIRPCQ